MPLLAAIENELSDWLAAAVDSAIVNGDAQGTHMDSDVTAADDARKALDGLRALTPAASKTDGANAASSPRCSGRTGITVSRNAWLVGQRRGVRIERLTERFAESDQRGLTASLRLAFASTQPTGSEAVALTFNLATS